jgi:hypothetical protein
LYEKKDCFKCHSKLSPVLLFKFSAFSQENAAKYDSREYWVATMIKIADPVLKNLSQEQLRAKMPVINKDSNRVELLISKPLAEH